MMSRYTEHTGPRRPGLFGQAPPAGQPQQPRPSGDLVLRISVALVQVDAVVTDRHSRHVAGCAHILTGGRVRPGSRMAPGEYIAQVVVTDNLAKEKYRTATQWIDFEVKPWRRSIWICSSTSKNSRCKRATWWTRSGS